MIYRQQHGCLFWLVVLRMYWYNLRTIDATWIFRVPAYFKWDRYHLHRTLFTMIVDSFSKSCLLFILQTHQETREVDIWNSTQEVKSTNFDCSSPLPQLKSCSANPIFYRFIVLPEPSALLPYPLGEPIHSIHVISSVSECPPTLTTRTGMRRNS